MTLVGGIAQQDQLGVEAGGQGVERDRGAVGGAVVDQHQPQPRHLRCQRLVHLAQELGDSVGLVERRDRHRHRGLAHRRQSSSGPVPSMWWATSIPILVA